MKNIRNESKLKRFSGGAMQYDSVALIDYDLEQIDKRLKMTSSSVERIHTIAPGYEPAPLRQDGLQLLMGTP
jgi:hypothetical protein